jgi:hypothetical protein
MGVTKLAWRPTVGGFGGVRDPRRTRRFRRGQRPAPNEARRLQVTESIWKAWIQGGGVFLDFGLTAALLVQRSYSGRTQRPWT